MRTFVRSAAALAVLCFTAHVQVQAATVASLHSRVNQLQMQVSALPGSDTAQPVISISRGVFSNETGLSPAATGGFEMTYFTGDMYAPSGLHTEAAAVNAQVLPVESVSLNSTDGIVQMQVQPDSISAGMVLSDTLIQQVLPTASSGMGSGDQRWGSLAGTFLDEYHLGQLGEANVWLVTLPAYSRVEISGAMSGSLSMDTTTLGTMLSPYANDDARMSLAMSHGFRMYAVSLVTSEEQYLESPSAEVFNAMQFDFDRDQPVQRTGWGSEMSFADQPFSLVMSNNSGEALTYELNLQYWQEATLFANGREFGSSVLGEGSVVPEPGTWALMGLGLAGIASVSRQRRKA